MYGYGVDYQGVVAYAVVAYRAKIMQGLSCKAPRIQRIADRQELREELRLRRRPVLVLRAARAPWLLRRRPLE